MAKRVTVTKNKIDAIADAIRFRNDESDSYKLDDMPNKIKSISGGGTTDYEELSNKPQINGTELVGNKTLSDLGIQATEEGKGLSSNDYTNTDKNKLAGLNNYDDTELNGRISDLENIIPSTASTSNKLATKDDIPTVPEAITNDTQLTNKPQIEGIELTGNKSLSELGIQSAEEGKGLSTNDFTDEEKTKLAELNNYNDARMLTALENKVDKVEGKGLSTNDYTYEDKSALGTLNFLYKNGNIGHQIKNNSNEYLTQRSSLKFNDSFKITDDDFFENTTVELNKASSNTLGGIKVGSGLSIDTDGILSTIKTKTNTMPFKPRYNAFKRKFVPCPFMLKKEDGTIQEETNPPYGNQIYSLDGELRLSSGWQCHYVLNKETGIWEWNKPIVEGDGWSNFYGQSIYLTTEKEYILGNSHKYNRSTKSWDKITMPAIDWFNAQNIWSDGIDTYYSAGDTQRKLNKIDDKNYEWIDVTWNGTALTKPGGENIWTDGNKIYHGEDFYLDIINKEFKKFDNKSQYNLVDQTNPYMTPFGCDVWTDGVFFYVSRGIRHSVFDPISRNCQELYDLFPNQQDANREGRYIWTDGKDIYWTGGAHFILSSEDVAVRSSNTTFLI